MSLLVFAWAYPQQPSVEEADAWAREEIGRLLAGGGVQAAELSRLGSASSRQGPDRDWMLVVELAPGVDSREWVDRGACADWLQDLRRLRLRPSVALVDPTIVMGAAGD